MNNSFNYVFNVYIKIRVVNVIFYMLNECLIKYKMLVIE